MLAAHGPPCHHTCPCKGGQRDDCNVFMGQNPRQIFMEEERDTSLKIETETEKRHQPSKSVEETAATGETPKPLPPLAC